MYPSSERIAAVGNCLWQHLYRAQTALEKLGAGDIRDTMPVLFAMYFFAVERLMQIPEEEAEALQSEYQDNVQNLADEGLIDRVQAGTMISAAAAAAGKIAESYLAEQSRQDPNPIRGIVKGTSGVLGLDYGEVNQELAASLADFVVEATARAGGRGHDHHQKGEEP